jgi:glyoxylase-like metal-dependent hydrolase (beta-lactamase superfamily II)
MRDAGSSSHGPPGLPAPLLETRVGGSVLVYSTRGETLAASYGANAVAVLGDGQTLLVDPLVAPAYARELKRLLAERGAGPVRWVVTTHHHTDHSVGASVFAEAGAEVLAHADAADRMREEHPGLLAERRSRSDVAALFADAVPAAPTRRVTGPLELRVGGVRIVVRPCGPAHTPGDLRLDLPELGIVVTGDLVSNGYHPNLENADVGGWRRGLEELLDSGATTFVPGHGAPGGREIVAAQLAWFDAAEEEVRSAVAEGLGNAAAEDRLRRRFPGFLLGIVVPTAVEVLRARG